eukprot:CAMPEP_0201281420 /NCGR_PEP_ID=MMETSP1317-20130820/2697_1 /ASSEMBLY_ACC=CAM_ASM_000770 /TAXON_ID=187299 /ORGANISM="Undescribed Undescribed, Strain Undescribed" /LENGTH=54 /DNA_ID=CAMNT_0047591167 /DNA_START=344 /DNA_END=508 /DNA_ORIENTATION=+
MRDPRKHVVSIVYLVKDAVGEPFGEDDAMCAKFYPVNEVASLVDKFAFDHYEIF